MGLLCEDPAGVLPEGSQVLAGAAAPAKWSIGHVTSSYFSPVLNRSIALAMVRGGAGMHGQRVDIEMPNGRAARAEVCGTVFFDPQGERQNVE